jgi:hypothetical protein
MRKLALFVLPVLTVSAALVACGSDVETLYGPPGGLRNAELPPPPSSTATTPPAGDSGTPPVADSGTSTSDGGEAGASNDGAAAANCTVSFSTQIYPKMQPAGTWQCSAGTCHGGTTMPVMDGTSATNTYTALAAYMINALPYVNPASTALTGSSFDCNLRGTCGSAQMPQTTNGATQASAADLTTLDTWIMCGAPNN